MPYFTTISPTCEPGGKSQAWDRFRSGGYIAIGWCYDTDLTGMSVESILELIPGTSASEKDAKDGLHAFRVFWELCRRGASGCGDYVAVKNVNHGLFGVGIVRSGYKYSRYKHDTGVPNHFYPHYLDVEWVWTEYIPTGSLIFGGEKRWAPYGTMGQLYKELPAYIQPHCRPTLSGNGFHAGVSGRLPEEVTDIPTLYEGALSRITVNAYERNPEARRKCIETHGTNCCVCGFRFGAVYGAVAEGYIHVHHLHPLSEVGAESVVDPVKDLRPVCPNCHAVLHLGGECRSIEEVSELVGRNRGE